MNRKIFQDYHVGGSSDMQSDFELDESLKTMTLSEIVVRHQVQ